MDEGETAGRQFRVNDATGKGLHGFVQGSETQVGDKRSGGKTESGDPSEAPRCAQTKYRAEDENESQHSWDGGGEEMVGGS